MMRGVGLFAALSRTLRPPRLPSSGRAACSIPDAREVLLLSAFWRSARACCLELLAERPSSCHTPAASPISPNLFGFFCLSSSQLIEQRLVSAARVSDHPEIALACGGCSCNRLEPLATGHRPRATPIDFRRRLARRLRPTDRSAPVQASTGPGRIAWHCTRYDRASAVFDAVMPFVARLERARSRNLRASAIFVRSIYSLEQA